MSARIRIRMKCTSVAPSGNDVLATLDTSGVKENVENVSFHNKSTPPAITLAIPISQPNAKGVFQVGKFYTFEIKPVET